MMQLGSFRLLPITIFALAGVLVMKSAQLVRAASGEEGKPAQATTRVAQPVPSPPAPSIKPPETAPASVSDGERAVLLELRQRRQELDTRETTLASRESLLVAAEQKLSARVNELQVLQKKLEALDAVRKEREDASWQGLVKLYESMKPRDAATIFNDLDMPVLLQVVDRMKEAKAAPVLAAMQPDKARELTAKIADMRTRHDNPSGG